MLNLMEIKKKIRFTNQPLMKIISCTNVQRVGGSMHSRETGVVQHSRYTGIFHVSSSGLSSHACSKNGVDPDRLSSF